MLQLLSCHEDKKIPVMNSVFCVLLGKLALLLCVSRKQEGEVTFPVKEPLSWLRVSFSGTFESTFCKSLVFEILNTNFKNNN